MAQLNILAPRKNISAAQALQVLKVSHLKTTPQLIGVRKVTENTQWRTARNGSAEENRTFWDEGYMIEVMVAGQLAYSGTPSCDSGSLQFAFQRAYDLALHSSMNTVFPYTPELRGNQKGSFKSPRKQELSAQNLRQFHEFLIESTRHLKTSEKIVTSLADVMLISTQQEYVNTNGADLHQDFLMSTSCFSATAQGEGETQTRSLWGPRGLTRQAGIEVFSETIKPELLRQTGEEALELLMSPNCPTQTCDALLHPSQMYIQIHESIGHPLEYDRILGDERNFAGWSFVKPTDFGNLQYGSSLLNVTFDPTVHGEFASYGFDDSGLPAKREHLIKDGILLRGLGGSESQARLKLPGVANMRSASWNRAPIDRMANLNVEAGTTRFEDMLAQVENGIYFDSNISWSIDDYRNKFQFGCEVGRIIKNGKLGHLVKNSNYRGSTLQFWRGLKAVGRPEDFEVFGTPFCGKGEPSQIIRVGHAAPPCLFSNIEVFGGGK